MFQFSQGYSSTLQPITATHTYDDVLPVLNLVWSLRDNLLMRFGFSRDLARPNLTDVAATTVVTVSGTRFNVKTGNPNIEPFLDNVYHVSFEWYPPQGTLLAVAPFPKDLLRCVAPQTTNTVFHANPFGVPDSLVVTACRSTPGCGPNSTWAREAKGRQAPGLSL